MMAALPQTHFDEDVATILRSLPPLAPLAREAALCWACDCFGNLSSLLTSLDMAQIYAEGNVLAHITGGDKEPVARCYDARDESFRTVVVIALIGFLPVSYGQDEEDHNLP